MWTILLVDQELVSETVFWTAEKSVCSNLCLRWKVKNENHYVSIFLKVLWNKTSKIEGGELIELTEVTL